MNDLICADGAFLQVHGLVHSGTASLLSSQVEGLATTALPNIRLYFCLFYGFLHFIRSEHTLQLYTTISACYAVGPHLQPYGRGISHG